MKRKKALKTAYLIKLFISHLGLTEIFQCNNSWEFKTAFLVLFWKYNIKIIYIRLRTSYTEGLEEQTNFVVKNKLQKCQTANSSKAWADALIVKCKTINNQTYGFFLPGGTLSQLMFLCKAKIWNTCLTSSTEVEKAVLRQLLLADMDENLKTDVIKKESTTVLASHHLFKKVPNLILIKKSKEKEDPNW